MTEPDEARDTRRERILADIKEGAASLESAPEELKRDLEVVMAAVKRDGFSLRFAATELRSDRDVVMAAVSQEGNALEHASQSLRSDREVVLTAVAHSKFALRFACDAMLDDDSFAVDERQCLYFFKIVALSGRSCLVALLFFEGVWMSWCLRLARSSTWNGVMTRCYGSTEPTL
mmetsp:Transcript_69283/g.129385  ORF Transcript_69283/g.129385 Transcript_69283/m.129385 type:complete len:175 (-) Transcript_69283:232-756(-)